MPVGSETRAAAPPEEVEIEVTWQDIREGERRDPDHCPIARAARRALPGCEDLVVDGVNIFWGAEEDRWIADLPPEAQQFVERFDHGEDKAFGGVAPLTFTIRPY